MYQQSKFKLYQRVRVIAPGRWHNRVGTVWQINSYCLWVMFNPWTAPKNRQGTPLPVSFNESELELR
jgi:hypothetical protein